MSAGSAATVDTALVAQPGHSMAGHEKHLVIDPPEDYE